MAPGFRNMKEGASRQNEKVPICALKTNIRNEIIEILSNVFDKSVDLSKHLSLHLVQCPGVVITLSWKFFNIFSGGRAGKLF